MNCNADGMMWNVFRFFVLALVCSSTFALASASSEVMSYREWKVSKIQEAEARLNELKVKSKDPNLSHKKGSEAGLNEELQSEIELEATNLSLSKDLTISDYFVGYLTNQSSLNAAITEVAGRLSPAEVAELMLAYAEHFSQPSRHQPRAGAVKPAARADYSQ